MTSISIEQIKAKRDYHANEVRRYDELLDLAQRLAKETKRADKHVDAARTRSATDRGKKAAQLDDASDERPIAVIGRVLGTDGEAMTFETIAEKSGLEKHHAKGKANRIVGVVLAQLKKQQLVRERADGQYVAKAKLVKLIASSTNGSGAEA